MLRTRVFKTCRRSGHENICSSVAFHPKRAWELVSGGLDCLLINWDFSRGKPCYKLNMQEVVTRDELFSDTYKMKVVDDIFYEVEGKVS